MSSDAPNDLLSNLVPYNGKNVQVTIEGNYFIVSMKISYSIDDDNKITVTFTDLKDNSKLFIIDDDARKITIKKDRSDDSKVFIVYRGYLSTSFNYYLNDKYSAAEYASKYAGGKRKPRKTRKCKNGTKGRRKSSRRKNA